MSGGDDISVYNQPLLLMLSIDRVERVRNLSAERMKNCEELIL